jgi:hypothetical protein
MNILANAFSINMLSGDSLVRFERMTQEQFAAHLRAGGFVSAIGHASTAAFLAERLGIQVPENRINVAVEPGVLLYVVQIKGRLPEGKVLSGEEIEAMPVEYWLVSQEQ